MTDTPLEASSWASCHGTGTIGVLLLAGDLRKVSMGSDQQGVTHGTDAGPDCLPVGSVGLPCCTPEGAEHTNCRGTRASKAASSVSPGAPTPSRCFCWTAAGVLGRGPLGMQPRGPQKWGSTLCPQPNMGQVWPFCGSQLSTFHFFFFFQPPVILIQCQPCAKHCSGHL